jgi:hypothetical protein
MEEVELKAKALTVPIDVLKDIAIIITKARMKNSIIDVPPNKYEVILEIHYAEQHPYHIKALANIENILIKYDNLRYVEEEYLNWRD